MKRAIFSVYYKEGVEKFAAFLEKKGYEILSTGGTYRYLREHGVTVKEVSEATGFPEVLDGRVKTLHPVIHAGILAMRSKPEHKKQLDEQSIPPVDFVVVNLYPFEDTVARQDAPEEEIIEQIDIGGVTLIRAAAKNFRDVAVIVDNNDFAKVMAEMEAGELSERTRLELAGRAFNHTAYYDALISTYFNRRLDTVFPVEGSVPLRRLEELRYGENPHQKAAIYRSYVDKNISILNADILWGKQLSYNNVMDADAALDILREFAGAGNFVTIIKHTNPCGAAMGKTLAEAYERALAGDPESAFGGIIALNQTVDKATAELIINKFCEIVIAPGYAGDALEVLKTKKNLRIVKLNGEDWSKKGQSYRRVENGMLAQDWDPLGTDYEKFETATQKKPTPEQERDLRFAWKIGKYVKSNAIVYVKGEQVIGVGAGQVSRVDSARIGVSKGVNFGFDVKGAVMASDAYIPFRDSVDTAAEQGIAAIIQPGGSVRDQESIDAANEHGMAMVFTGTRHFKH